MSNIVLWLVALATVLNGINVWIIIKRLEEDETVIANLIERKDDE